MMSENARYLYEVLFAGFDFRPPHPNRSLPEVVRDATEAVEKHLKNSPLLRAYLETVPKGPGTDCPDSPLDELVYYVATQKGWVDKKDPYLNLRFLARFVLPVFEMERHVVERAIHGLRAITEQQELLFLDCILHARAVDRLWQRWFEKVAAPFQSLDKEGQERQKKKLGNILPPYDYTAFEIDPFGDIQNRRPWAKAFPKEIAAIDASLRELEETEDQYLAEYFRALRLAYTCDRIENLEERWAEVDRAWVLIPSDSEIIPVHGMESAYGHAFCVSPEFRLEFRTPDSIREIELQRKAAVEHADKILGLSNALILEASKKLRRIDVSVFTPGIRAGSCIDFRYAGQAVPNRQAVLLIGGKIFVDQSDPARVAERYQTLILRHCAPHTAAQIAPLLTREMQIMGTITHEFAHPIGRTSASDEMLGHTVVFQLEEGKATLGGICAEEYADPSPEHRLQLVANAVGRMLRFMQHSEITNPTIAPYVRENLVTATTLYDAGILSLSKQGLEIDIGMASSPYWFQNLRVFYGDLVAAYESKDAAAIASMTTLYANPDDPQIVELIEWVNRELPAAA